MSAIRLLIVDDHPIMRDGLRGVFSDDPGLEAGGGAEAVRLAQRVEADVILMDLRMPAMGGVEAITRARAFGAWSAAGGVGGMAGAVAGVPSPPACRGGGSSSSTCRSAQF
jgi:CheY-like chemotaxis protein